MTVLDKLFGAPGSAPARAADIPGIGADICKVVDGLSTTTTVVGGRSIFQLEVPAAPSLYAQPARR